MSAPRKVVEDTITGFSSASRKRKRTANKRWTKEMDSVLIPCLADLAKAGLKVNKSFKRQAFVEAANLVNRRFPLACMDANNVENHMRTLKQKYQDIKKLMNLNGVGWNNTRKMLVLEDETYRTYVEAQPKAKEYLNKFVPFFRELQLVCGDDYARGEYAQTIFHQFGVSHPVPDNQPDGLDTMDSEPSENNYQQQEQPMSFSSNPNSRTAWASRATTENDVIINILEKVYDMVSSMWETKKKTWKDKLIEALWSMEGYSNKDMAKLYVTLRADRNLAEDFYLRNARLRKRFVDRFIAERMASGQ
ncbi:hypothetical protein J5N97_028514 [Dioscorea zingiberensis]|uniref:Myb/SANT-like domain-containing protein n=1 Tax=Dioscorea zingiberensis TaxID=325984 RepID=A0A9D5H4Y5_9LILI|nr:hypothetical protein J5N97_028514 [Dioscorea zingiberensis]